MIQSWEEWVTHQRAVLPFIEQVESGDPLTLLCPGESTSGIQCVVLVFLVQERQGTCSESPAEGNKDDWGLGAFPS